MLIRVTAGTGTGPTELAAFDAALLDAGVANYNLLPLSSIIPPGSRIETGKYVTPENEYGYRLYVVLAQQETSSPGEEAWAGLGWTQDVSGKRLFVECHGSKESQVKEEMEATLRAMIANRREYPGGALHDKIVGIRCVDQPVSARMAVSSRGSL